MCQSKSIFEICLTFEIHEIRNFQTFNLHRVDIDRFRSAEPIAEDFNILRCSAFRVFVTRALSSFFLFLKKAEPKREMNLLAPNLS